MKFSPQALIALLAISIVLVFAPEKQAVSTQISGAEAKLEAKLAPLDHFSLKRSYPDMQLDWRAYEAALQSARAAATLEKTQTSSIDNTPWTLEGPGNIGGRINAIAIDPNNNSIILVGCAAGGIFKTTDAGSTWNPIFDDAGQLAIGDITFEPGNSQVIYAGTGDPNISGYPVIGDGIYKSTDAGNTWTHLGLTATRIISRIVIDPNNVNKIYAGTMGLPMQRNNARGLFSSTDGGTTWAQVLFVSDQAGIIDLVMDPNNSQILYASSWDRIRTNQESIVTGTNAKVWRTTDGGANWAALAGGLPTGVLSRVNLSIDNGNPANVYACFVDTTQNVRGIYKSNNNGNSWAAINTSTLGPGELGGFGWYFGNIFVNPFQPNELYLLGVQLWRTTDNGANWGEVDPPWWAYTVHADKHDIVFT
ncbi:MAG TPA: hypothetical protein ENJ82_09615, partial [Bacteroidetes bacterium]|nr:hypothetical protein [Bacteroidota bacterium]